MLEVFRHQAEHTAVYAEYLSYVGCSPNRVESVASIPFLPIRFFKSHDIRCGSWEAETVFRSSGTTHTGNSQHAVRDREFYLTRAADAFQYLVQPIAGTVFLAVLPSYTDRPDASLVAMAEYFVRLTGHPLSGFCLEHPGQVSLRLDEARKSGRPVILLGVTFALLDLVQSGVDFTDVLVMETGGMKGRRREIIRPELHEILRQANPKAIWSEYGMTELLSQAYALEDGPFRPAAGMHVLIREINDPFRAASGTGLINVIDLANLHSCSFIETQDLGKVHGEGFDVLGRLDYSDVRGCNLMVA